MIQLENMDLYEISETAMILRVQLKQENKSAYGIIKITAEYGQ